MIKGIETIGNICNFFLKSAKIEFVSTVVWLEQKLKI